jgi:hypothetical protein
MIAVSMGMLGYAVSNIGYICRINRYEMNLQEFLAPIEALFMFSFDVLKAGGNNFNYLLVIIIALALVYWTVKLMGYEKSEVTNR